MLIVSYFPRARNHLQCTALSCSLNLESDARRERHCDAESPRFARVEGVATQMQQELDEVKAFFDHCEALRDYSCTVSHVKLLSTLHNIHVAFFGSTLCFEMRLGETQDNIV